MPARRPVCGTIKRTVQPHYQASTSIRLASGNQYATPRDLSINSGISTRPPGNADTEENPAMTGSSVPAQWPIWGRPAPPAPPPAVPPHRTRNRVRLRFARRHLWTYPRAADDAV